MAPFQRLQGCGSKIISPDWSLGMCLAGCMIIKAHTEVSMVINMSVLFQKTTRPLDGQLNIDKEICEIILAMKISKIIFLAI
jgi:hypothetical protein